MIVLYLFYICSKVRVYKKSEKRPQNPENISYAHNPKKYPKGCYHKILKKSKNQSTSRNLENDIIFVNLQIFWATLVFWLFFGGGNSVPQLSRIRDLLYGIEHDTEAIRIQKLNQT